MILQEKDYLEVYKKESEDQLGWGSSTEWTNQDFEKLGELIFEKTGIRLSASTLKRVWGKVKYDSAPTLTTLNTLAQFSGYENWRNFRSQTQTKLLNGHSNGNGVHTHDDRVGIAAEPAVTEKPVAKSTTSIWKIVGAFMLTGVAVVLYFNLKSGTKVDPSNASFEARVVSDDLPNSVVFDYNIGDASIDSVTIQQSWDPKRRERVSSDRHQHTSIYYFPGVFQAKLLAGEQVVKEREVYIQTRGWKGIVSQGAIPTYLSADEIGLRENTMHIDSETLHSKTGKSVFNEIWTEFYDMHPFESVNPNNFSFEVTLQNTSSKEQAVCQNAKVTLLGSGGVIAVPLCGKGCTSAIGAYIAGTYISGKDTDLSAFGCDFSKPQQLRFEVTDGKLKVYINKLEVFAFADPVNLGKIEGMIVGFEGTGQILDLAIK